MTHVIESFTPEKMQPSNTMPKATLRIPPATMLRTFRAAPEPMMPNPTTNSA